MKSRPAQPELVGSLAPGHETGRKVRVHWLAWSLCMLCVVLALSGLILALLNGRGLGEVFVEDSLVTIAVLAVVFSIVGALIASHRPGNPIGWIFCFAALFQGLIIFGEEYATYALLTNPGSLPLGPEASWLKEWIWAPGLGLILVFLPLLFPDGRPPSRRWWWVAWLGGLSIGLICVLGSILLWPERGPSLMGRGGKAEYIVAPVWALVIDFVAIPMMLVAGLGAVISLLVRFRRARGDERQQIKWFASASALTLAFCFAWEELPKVWGELIEAILNLLGILIVPAIPVATGIAIFRYHLYDIDLIINRTLVYGVLTACVVGTYVIIVGYLGALFRTDGDLAISLVATGIIAVLFAPLRDRLQRIVNRLMYGERDDPYAALSRLGQHLEATLEPHAVLPAVAESVAHALKLPHVAIELKWGEEYETAAEHGWPAGEPLRLPLVYGTETVGRIVLSSRAPGESFGPADRRLLDDLARQAGVAAHAVRLTDDLQRSRERLVTAREEERRRLRRNLHDGLGPALSSAMLKLGAARRLLPSDSLVADLIVEVRDDMRATIADVRGLVYDLRPPALDQLGLELAIRDYAEQCASEDEDGMRVTVDAPEQLSLLPAAVEVAAYYIAREALTNAARHARARSCSIHLALQDGPERVELRLEITDDGVGLPHERHLGVGLSSMRERVEELGGKFSVESPPEGGTRVVARLPVGKE